MSIIYEKKENTMKNKILAIAGALLFVLGCTPTELTDTITQPKDARMSIGEAKQAFENEYSFVATKSAGTARFKGKLHSGDFTPVWEKARYSDNNAVSSYDVNIISDRKLSAIRAKFENGRSIAARVNVYQKLVVVKNSKKGKINSFLLYLIPEVGSDGGESMVNQYLNSKADKGKFTGLAIYKSLYSEMIIKVSKFDDGKCVRSVFVPAGDGSVRERVEKAASMLKGISFSNRRSVAVKSYGEEDWDDWDDWDYGSSDDYTDEGDGYFSDSDGNLYFDTDGDGMPDTMVIEASICTPDDDVIVDPPFIIDDWPVYDDPDPYYPPDPEEETEDDYYYDDYYGDDENQEKSKDEPDKCEKSMGTPQYYIDREKDFVRRYGDKILPPKYYSTYGYEYCSRFNSDRFNNKISDKGKEWVGKVTIALQEKLYQILLKNPGIELNETKFEYLVFDSHVSAYVDSGLLDLPMSDKLNILFEVDLDVLFLENGKKQVYDVLEKQIEYYVLHPYEVGVDAYYIVNHVTDIFNLIADNIERTKAKNDTKSISFEYSEQEVFDILFGRLIKYYEDNIPGFEMPPLQ